MSTWQLHTNTEWLDLIDFAYLNGQLSALNEFTENCNNPELINKIDEYNKKAIYLLKEYFTLSEEMDKVIKGHNLKVWY